MPVVKVLGHLGKRRDLALEIQYVRSCYQQCLCILPGVNIILRRSQHHKTFTVDSPPVFDCQMNNMLRPLVVYAVLSHSTFNNKSCILTYFPFLQKVLFLSESLWEKCMTDPVLFAVGEFCCCVAVDIINKGVVHYLSKVFMQK